MIGDLPPTLGPKNPTTAEAELWVVRVRAAIAEAERALAGTPPTWITPGWSLVRREHLITLAVAGAYVADYVASRAGRGTP